MSDHTSNNRVSLPPDFIDVFLELSPPRSSSDVESVNVNKKQKKEEIGKLNDRMLSGVTRELASPSSSNHSCGAFQRIQTLQAKVDRLDERSLMMREDICFIRKQTMEYFENSDHQ